MNFDEALEAGAAFFMEDHPAAEKQYINAKLCTNQPGYVERNGNNGCVVSYAQGSMDFFRTVKNPGKINQRNVDGFKTPRGEGLKYLFDDRTAVQPFAKQSADKLGLRVERAQNGVIATFTLESWGNGTFTVPMQDQGGILVGVGPAIGNKPGIENAVYTLSFEVWRHAVH